MMLTNGSVQNLVGLQADITIQLIVLEKFSQNDHHMELRKALKMTLSDYVEIGRCFENRRKHSDRDNKWKDMCWSETQQP